MQKLLTIVANSSYSQRKWRDHAETADNSGKLLLAQSTGRAQTFIPAFPRVRVCVCVHAHLWVHLT